MRSISYVTHRFPPPPSVTRADRLMRCESVCAAAFESRWTRRALQRVDPDLSRRLDEQRDLFTAALLSGDEDDIVQHGEAMVRGWQAAYARMAAKPDDPFLVGGDPASGALVVIGPERSAEARVRALYGDEVVFLTPDEVAERMAPIHKAVAKVKALWPGAEIISVKQKAPEGGNE